jgi:hypothetical protein
MNANRRSWTAAVVLAALPLAGCGQSSASMAPVLSGVPLAARARVVAHIRRCDRGANPYCAVQLVLVGARYRSSAALLSSERRRLESLGWGPGNGDTGDERAADSPGHKLRLTYATAALDLKDIDLGWINRSRLIAMTLSREMFDRAPALSLMLETGPS